MKIDHPELPARLELTNITDVKKWLENLANRHNSSGAIIYYKLDSIDILAPLVIFQKSKGKIKNFLRVLPVSYFETSISHAWAHKTIDTGEKLFEIAWHTYKNSETASSCMVLLFSEDSERKITKLNSISQKYPFWKQTQQSIASAYETNKKIYHEIIGEITKKFYEQLSYPQAFNLFLRKIKDFIVSSNIRLLTTGKTIPSKTNYSGWNSSKSSRSEEIHKLFQSLVSISQSSLLPHWSKEFFPKWAKNSLFLIQEKETLSLKWLFVKEGRNFWKSEEFLFLDQI